MKKIIFSFILLAFVALLALTQTSCKKKKATQAQITIVDSRNQPVIGATVFVNSNNNNPPGIVNDTQVSDSKGKTYHTFKDEAILQVEVTKKSTTAATLTGYGILRLEENKTVELTIVVN